MARYRPIIGEWYRTPEGDVFEVVAIDLDDGEIEIQYADGSVEALDLESWFMLAALPSPPPEDWSGPLDLAPEDLQDLEDYTLAHMREGYDYLNDVDGLG